MINFKRKSSLQVPLVLLGSTALLVGCSSDGVRKPSRGETRYDYRNREDCVKDWGETCPPDSQVSNQTSTYHFYRREEKAKAKSQTHAVKVVRGGFGGRSSGS